MARRKKGVASSFEKDYLPDDPGAPKKGMSKKEKQQRAEEQRKKRIEEAYEKARKAIDSGNSVYLNGAKVALTLLLTDKQISNKEREKIVEKLEKIERILSYPAPKTRKRKTKEVKKKEQKSKQVNKEEKTREEKQRSILKFLFPRKAFKRRQAKKSKQMEEIEERGVSAEFLYRQLEDELLQARMDIANAKTEKEKQKASLRAKLLRKEMSSLFKETNAYPIPISTIHEKGLPVPFLSKLFRKDVKEFEKAMADNKHFLTEPEIRRKLKEDKAGKFEKLLESLNRRKKEKERLNNLRRKYR